MPNNVTEGEGWESEFEVFFARWHDPDGIVKPLVKSFIKDLLAKRDEYWKAVYENCPQCTGLREEYKKELIEKMQTRKSNEYGVRSYGKYEARTWDEKHLANAVIDEIIKLIQSN